MDLQLTDIGANLCGKAFHGDREETLKRAQASGVRRILLTASDVAETIQALELAEKHPGFLYATAGVHPHLAAKTEPGWQQELRRLAANPLICAIGETGLDFNRNYSPPETQREIFADQLRLAAETGLPVFLHERDASAAFQEIFKPWQGHLHGVLHCFTGDTEALNAWLDMGLHIGVTGWICDERRGQALQSAVREIPDDRLLIETDAPYLLPRDLPSTRRRNEASLARRNEPAFLDHIAAQVAHFRGQSLAHVARITHENAGRLFGL